MTQQELEAFRAKGGKINRVADNATCGMTARDFYRAARDPVAAPVEITNALIDERHIASTDHMNRAHIVNGLGETIAFE